MATFKDAARDAYTPNEQDRHPREICGHLSGDRLDSSDVLVSADSAAVHCESRFLRGQHMKQTTVSVDEETQRLTRKGTVELDSSVSALVRQYLRDLVSGGMAVPPLTAQQMRQQGLKHPGPVGIRRWQRPLTSER